ncbi:YrdB family protein [Paenibacillus harenae]|uniref:YrdB family protein n=1 Tax=Paenibacillus harenae TaxID=306543 RepID=UPI0004200D3B|nr:YrdB family protein [Paenibacillus harenae]
MFIALNLALRFLLELVLLASLGNWGYHLGEGTLSKIVLAAGLPLATAIIWGLIISPKTRVALPIASVVLIEFLLVGTAAYGLIRLGFLVFAVVYATVHIANRLLLLLMGGKEEDLLKPFNRS